MLLVYLHGFGYDMNENRDFTQKLANKFNAKLFTPNAPYSSGRERGGFSWYTLTPVVREHIYDEKFEKSLAYITDLIQNELDANNMDWKDVILCGRSQGAFMSMYLTLHGPVTPNRVISFCGSYPDEIVDRGISDRSTPIYWVEGAKDTRESQSRKDTYKRLIKEGCNIKYLVDENSDHHNLADSILDML
jgi:predicted esterase